MTRTMKLLLLLAVAALVVVGFTSQRSHALMPPTITVSSVPTVGVVTTFTTEQQLGRKQWTWQYLSGGAYKVGGQMGEGTSVDYAFPESAASKPYVVVMVKVTSGGGTNNFVVGQRAFVVGSN